VSGEKAHDSEERPGLARQVWRSVFRRPVVPRTDRERAWTTLNLLLLHLRPVRLRTATLRWTHTFGLGGSSLVLIAVLAGTGILLMLHYQPAPDLAYASIERLQDEVLFGSLVRAVHHWTAQLLLVVVLLHVARVFLTGGFHGPRQFNWVLGCCLLASVLAASFTGYLLPWDQLSYWAVTITTAMATYVPGVGELLQRVLRGGPEVGAATMTNFYTVHTTIVPVLLIVIMSFHFWRVRKADGVVVPPPRDGDGQLPDKVLFLPHLLGREVAQALVLVAVVLMVAVAFEAPLGAPANPGMSPNPAKAPWYFMGFQELLIHLHPLVAVVLLPLGLVAAAFLLPYVTRDDEPAGAWFLSTRGKRLSAVCAVTALVAVPLWVVVDDLVGGPGGGWISAAAPIVVLLLGGWALLGLLRRRLGATLNEAVQALVVLLAVGLAVLTVIGVWFRGPGMALVWPWMR
jgi:quinol-cytochrome oxidoreductase complex cytochrome b subunit